MVCLQLSELVADDVIRHYETEVTCGPKSFIENNGFIQKT